MAGIGHIVLDRSAVGAGPLPIGQVPVYVIGVASLFAVMAMARDRPLTRRRPPAPPTN